MTEAQNFYYGGATFPLALSADTGNTLLRDADPALFYGLEFYASIIATHLGARLIEEATAAGATQIASAVAETLPLDPERFLTSEQIRFPLLALYRKSTTYRYINRRRAALHKMELVYVLPPMKPGEAERVLPILHAVGLLIDNKSMQGFDPGYTPSAPTGTAGEFVWSYHRAGIRKVDVKESSLGGYAASDELFMPAIVMSIEMDEMGDASDLSYAAFAGADVGLDLKAPDGTIVDDVANIQTDGPPTLVSLSPTSGVAAGNTTVTLDCPGVRVGTRPRVLFDGAAADAVTVTNGSTITCKTPPHAAYPSFTAGVMVIAADGQSTLLRAAYTFNA